MTSRMSTQTGEPTASVAPSAAAAPAATATDGSSASAAPDAAPKPAPRPPVRRKNFRKREEASSDSDDETSAVVKPAAGLKKKLNSFSTSVEKKAAVPMLLQVQEESKRDAAPVTNARGGAAVQLDIDDNSKRTGNKWTGIGPVKAPTHFRSTARFDYQPDICKDYKDTGFCGYGDSCKFMHDRGDYKAGWQIEREWDAQQKKRTAALAAGMGADAGDSDGDDNKYAIDSDTDDLPFACFICREPFESPVETKCKHYFCQDCAFKRYAKNSTCAACGKQTFGVFNAAARLCELIVKRKKREAAEALARAREAAEEEADQPEDDEA